MSHSTKYKHEHLPGFLEEFLILIYFKIGVVTFYFTFVFEYLVEYLVFSYQNVAPVETFTFTYYLYF